MSKGVAVHYIIAIILGVLVIGVVGYWFFISAGGGTSTGNELECRSKALTYCNYVLNNAYAKPNGQDFQAYVPECQAFSWSKFSTCEVGLYCKNLLGQSLTDDEQRRYEGCLSNYS